MAAKPEGKPAGEEVAAAPKPSTGGGGLKAWMPLLANLILMPVMGYLTVNFLMVPRTHVADAAAEGGAASTEKPAKGADGKNAPAKGELITVALGDKVIANVQNTQGTRYLLAKIALGGTAPNFEKLVAKHDDELRDAANSVLQSKTITDIDKPGAKNLIRAELLAVFNNILGPGVAKEVFLIEFAMQ